MAAGVRHDLLAHSTLLRNMVRFATARSLLLRLSELSSGPFGVSALLDVNVSIVPQKDACDLVVNVYDMLNTARRWAYTTRLVGIPNGTPLGVRAELVGAEEDCLIRVERTDCDPCEPVLTAWATKLVERVS